MHTRSGSWDAAWALARRCGPREDLPDELPPGSAGVAWVDPQWTVTVPCIEVGSIVQ
jgi:hypothetical protein